MKTSVTIVGLFALVASVYCSVYPVVPAATLIRSPQHDSAVVHSERSQNGNFAYSTVEGHGYQAIQQVVRKFKDLILIKGLDSYLILYSTIHTILDTIFTSHNNNGSFNNIPI